jgi:hypothetical protein
VDEKSSCQLKNASQSVHMHQNKTWKMREKINQKCVVCWLEFDLVVTK